MTREGKDAGHLCPKRLKKRVHYEQQADKALLLTPAAKLHQR